MDMLEALLLAASQALFGRVQTPPSEMANQPMRRRLLGLIGSHPGIHASELCREAGQPWGTVQYHLALLDRSQLVTSVASGRERRFFPADTSPARARLVALLSQGRRGEIAAFIRDHPGQRQVDICQALDLSRKTFRAALAPMVGEGLVKERKGLQTNRYFPEPPLAEVMAGEAPDAAASLMPEPEFA
ncbi:MAG: winged helix-turn-helix transcriptional regulator [Thermoplasmatota archaeon]